MTAISTLREERRYPDHWRVEPFTEVVFDETGGQPKIKKGDYLDAGSLPVIDQGQASIGGYVDDDELACHVKLPCILFGDHTRVFKWVNEPFALGADGVKVLTTRDDLHPRYAFHYLRTVRLPDNAGYSRHFKFLKRIQIPIPPLSEQRRIADILDKTDAIRRKRREATGLTDRLLTAAFRDRFGDPVSNSRNWPTVPLKKYGVVTTGNTPSRKVPENYGTAIEWIKSDNINTPFHYLTRAMEGLSEVGKKLARTVLAGATLVTCIAGSRDCVGNAAMTDRKVAFNQQINAVTPSPTTDPCFLYTLILLSKPLVQRSSTESMKGMVSKGKFEQIQVIDVPPKHQKNFGQVFKRILATLDNQHAAATESDGLFNSLVQRAFRGEL